MESPEVSQGKIYVGKSLPAKLDQSITTKNGDKPYEGTLAVTGPAFIGGHSANAKGVLNVGTDLGDFKPGVAGRALDVEGDASIVGSSNNTSALSVKGDTTLAGDGKVTGNLRIDGTMSAGNATWSSSIVGTTKLFDIEHPTKGKGYRLSHACLEGPEHGVYYRGRLTKSNTIELPSYCKDLLQEASITVQLQPIGSTQKIIVMEFDNEKIILSGNTDCFFHVFGERKDVNSLTVEYEGNGIF